MNIDFKTENLITLNQDFTQKEYCNSVAIINGFEMCKIIDTLGDDIFNNNIRLYLGENQPINKKIIETIYNDPSWFFSYNNGITIETTKVNSNNNIINLENASIINGAQSLNSLYYVYKNMQKDNFNNIEKYFSNIKILTKIIVVPTIKGIHSYFLTKYVNSQNTIKISDYFSNQKNQNKIKDYLKNNFNLLYEIKRGKDTSINKNNYNKPFLNLENFNRNFWAIFNNPSTTNIKNKSLFLINESNGFSDNENQINKLLDKEFDLTIKKMLFSQFLLDAIKEELDNFIKLYDNYNNLFLNVNQKNQNAQKIWNLFSNIHNEEIKNIQNAENWTEKILEPFDFFIKGKGKYIYSFFVKIFIETFLNQNEYEGFEKYINSLKSLEDLIYLKLRAKKILHEINKIINPIFIQSKKSEGQIIGTFDEFFITKFKESLNFMIKDKIFINNFNNFWNNNYDFSIKNNRKIIKNSIIKLKLEDKIIEDTSNIKVFIKFLKQIGLQKIINECNDIFTTSFLICESRNKNINISENTRCTLVKENNINYSIFIHSSQADLIKRILKISNKLNLNLLIL